MTREEEIIQAADECYPTWEEHNAGFYKGAKLADKNPRKELWDAEKVCKYLKEHAGHYMSLNSDEEGEIQAEYNPKYLIEDLIKAMEG